MQPILVLPPDSMTDEDIQRLRDNEICVVVSSDPTALRFVDPPPSGNYDLVTDAALQLSRVVMNNPNTNYTGQSLAAWWAQVLINAHPVRKQTVAKTEEITRHKKK